MMVGTAKVMTAATAKATAKNTKKTSLDCQLFGAPRVPKCDAMVSGSCAYKEEKCMAATMAIRINKAFGIADAFMKTLLCSVGESAK